MPANPDSEPPVTPMSAAVKVVVATLAANVIVTAAPSVTVPLPDREIVSVGATVSTVNAIVLPAALSLPARSVKPPAATPIVAAPW